MKKSLYRFATPLVAIAIILPCYLMARFPCISAGDCMKLAANFKFDKLPLAEVTNHPPYKYVRQVHPSLQRISAWISTLGASVALADLDGDGLPNDLINVDPRTDLVTVAPASGTGNRYAPFTLNLAPLPFNASNTAPMGVLVGDFRCRLRAGRTDRQRRTLVFQRRGAGRSRRRRPCGFADRKLFSGRRARS